MARNIKDWEAWIKSSKTIKQEQLKWDGRLLDESDRRLTYVKAGNMKIMVSHAGRARQRMKAGSLTGTERTEVSYRNEIF